MISYIISSNIFHNRLNVNNNFKCPENKILIEIQIMNKNKFS